MINVEIFDDFILKEKDLESNSLEVLLSVDCHMKITIASRIFYEDWICPIELYYHYKIWINKLQLNQLSEFVYITEDNSINPILAFYYIDDNKWIIDSCYKKYDEQKIFTKKEVLDFFEQFEKLLFLHVCK